MCAWNPNTHRHVRIADIRAINCSHRALLTLSPALCLPIYLHRGPYVAVQTSAQTQTGTTLCQNHRPPKRKIPCVLSIRLVSGPGCGMGDWLKFKIFTVVEVLGKGRAQGGAERRWALLLVLIPAHSWEFALSISTFVYDMGRLRGWEVLEHTFLLHVNSLQESLKLLRHNFFLTLPTSTFHNRVILSTTKSFSISEMSKTGVKKGKQFFLKIILTREKLHIKQISVTT